MPDDEPTLNEKRLFSVTTYRAGWNMPGYLPEVEPVAFIDWQDAHGFLHTEVNVRWDEAQIALDPDDDSTDYHPDAIYLPVDVALNSATYGEGFGATTGDGKTHYWIEPVEEVITLDRLDAIRIGWEDEFQAMIEDGSEWNVGSLSADQIAPILRWKYAYEAINRLLVLAQDPNLRHTETQEFLAAIPEVAMYADLIADAIVTDENEE